MEAERSRLVEEKRRTAHRLAGEENKATAAEQHASVQEDKASRAGCKGLLDWMRWNEME